MEATESGTTHVVSALRAVSRPYRLVALPSAVTCARHLARAQAREWRLDQFAEVARTAELLVSELVTLAVRGIPAPRCYADLYNNHLSHVILRMAISSADLLVGVWDSRSTPPVLRDVAGAAENGRELHIVDALSRDWGHYSLAGGKVVWCAVALGPYQAHDAIMITPHRAHASPADTSRRAAPSMHHVGSASVLKVVR